MMQQVRVKFQLVVQLELEQAVRVTQQVVWVKFQLVVRLELEQAVRAGNRRGYTRPHWDLGNQMGYKNLR
ncbi:MAG TPA: hypothetical protein V6D18_07185 [Thermosynechococcaceae cyanobacterium]